MNSLTILNILLFTDRHGSGGCSEGGTPYLTLYGADNSFYICLLT